MGTLLFMASLGAFAAIFNEQREILLCKRNYGPRNWTLPGGSIEDNESLNAATVREVEEETGYIVHPEYLVSVSYNPAKDDLVFCTRCTIQDKKEWTPDDEIEDIRFFPLDALPDSLSPGALQRVKDAFNDERGVLREISYQY